MKFHQSDLVEVNFLFPDGTRGSHNWGQTPFVRDNYAYKQYDAS